MMNRALFILMALLGMTLQPHATATDLWWSGEKDLEQNEVVVLIHGLGRSNIAMWRFAHRLEDAGYEVHRVGYSSINTTPEEIIEDITRQINACCARESRTVHCVGHSFGGLLVRAYLQDNPVSNLGHAVLVGTPNNGTGIADLIRDNCLVRLLVPTASVLGTDGERLPSRLEAPYFPVGVIAGVYESDLNEAYLPGPDDGVVSVESTKLEGMTDFIEIKSGHSMMRYNENVARQVIFFLRERRFRHE